MKKITLFIEGMSCASCSRSLEKALQDKPGVEKAAVNFAAAKAYVEYDPGAVSREDIIQAVKDAGFEGSPEEAADEEGEAGVIVDAVFKI